MTKAKEPTGEETTTGQSTEVGNDTSTDTMAGGDSATDTISGDEGNDTLSGGDGEDLFNGADPKAFDHDGDGNPGGSLSADAEALSGEGEGDPLPGIGEEPAAEEYTRAENGTVRNAEGKIVWAPPGSYDAAANGVQQDASGHMTSANFINSPSSNSRA